MSRSLDDDFVKVLSACDDDALVLEIIVGIADLHIPSYFVDSVSRTGHIFANDQFWWDLLEEDTRDALADLAAVEDLGVTFGAPPELFDAVARSRADATEALGMIRRRDITQPQPAAASRGTGARR